MFEGRYSPRRRVDPPLPVLVDLSRLWPPTRVRWGTDTPLWVRSHGAPVDTAVPGELTDWVLTKVGDWCGVCRFTVRVDNSDLPLVQMVPRAAIRPRRDGGRDGGRR